MNRTIAPLASHLLYMYSSGMTVDSIAASTGLAETAILTRLCVASRLRPNQVEDCPAGYESYRVHWEFVSCRN
jgi:hypothetical protein